MHSFVHWLCLLGPDIFGLDRLSLAVLARPVQGQAQLRSSLMAWPLPRFGLCPDCNQFYFAISEPSLLSQYYVSGALEWAIVPDSPTGELPHLHTCHSGR